MNRQLLGADLELEYVGAANYPGDVRPSFVGQLVAMGPTTDGRYVLASGVSYDPEANRTRVEFVGHPRP